MSDYTPVLLFDRRRLLTKDVIIIQAGNISTSDIIRVLSRHMIGRDGNYLDEKAAFEYLMDVPFDQAKELIEDFAKQTKEILTPGT